MSVNPSITAVLISMAVVGCASGGSTASTPVAQGPTVVPLGVDTVVAAAADSLADASFVASPEQDQALELQQQGQLMVERTDSLWFAMSALIDSGRVVTDADSAEASAATMQGGTALVALDSLLRTSDLEVEALAAQTGVLLDSAELALEQAFQLNPFDTRSQVWLAQVYGLQARRLGQEEAYPRAIDELEKLALLTPDRHTVYAMLANNYFYVSNWDGAALNYQTAEDVYLATYDLVLDETPPLDSATVFSYVQAQGDMHIQRLDAMQATAAYDRALPYGLTAEDSAYIAGEMEWMAWDDMNIASSMARDSLLQLEQAGDLAGARSGYAALLAGLTSRAASDETDWRLAIVDYNLGSQEEAAGRLQELVARTPIDAAGAPIDPTYVRYFDDYGTLCLNLGRSARVERRDNRTALKYFTQASELAWPGSAVAHYEVARLVQGNLPAALEHATIAATDVEELTVEQRLDLYRLLMELNRRAGDFDKAREFRDAFTALRDSRG
ncbi:MAG: tetratricopeptide repeat protein [Longimicrobiales bacterium]